MTRMSTSLGLKLMIAVGVLVLVAAVIALVGMRGMRVASHGLETVYRDRVVSLTSLKTMSDGYAVTIINQANKLRNGSANWADSGAVVTAARLKADAAWDIYLHTMETDEEWQLIDAAKKVKRPADTFCDHLMEIIARHDWPALDRAATAEMYPAIDPLIQSLRALTALQERVSSGEFTVVQRAVAGATWSMGACIVLSAAIAAAIFRFVLIGVARPLRKMTTAIASLAEGQLDVDIGDRHRRDEVGQAARAVAVIADNLRRLTTDLRQLIEAVRMGHLSCRVDAKPHSGDYRELVSGLNELIEAMAAPTREIAQVMQKLAAGDITIRLTGTYEGDLRALKANLNRSLETIALLCAEFGTAAAAVAKGNLTTGIQGSYQGSFADIGLDFNAAVQSLREAMQEVAAGTVRIATATAETTAAANLVAGQSARQSEMLTGISSAVEQSAVAAQEISRNAELGSGLLRDAASLADDGRDELRTLLEDVERIAESNSHVTKITERIARIADKTHLLSLNAGIEAARAGTEGNGFGVVAHEIGKLAEEAATAVQDIDRLISEATASVAAGVSAARRCVTTMDRIGAAAADNQVTVQGIASAITQQSSAVHSLSAEISVLHRIGEENATAAGQIDKAMAEVAEMAERLKIKTDVLVLA